MLQNYVDSYLVVVLALNDLQDKGKTIETRKLVTQLHLTVQELYQMGLLRHLDSSFVEVLDNALGRLAQMGVCEAQAFETPNGARVVYVSVPAKEEHSRRLQQTADLLSALASTSFDAAGDWVPVQKRDRAVAELQRLVTQALKDISGLNIASL